MTSQLHDRLQGLLDKFDQGASGPQAFLGVQSLGRDIDLRFSTANASPGDPIFIASVTKMFTATLIMQLVQDGRIDLDDTAQSYLPDVNFAGLHTYKGSDLSNTISVRHLLHQTSGLFDYFEGAFFEHIKQNRDRRYDLDDVLDTVRGKPAKSEPGGNRSFYSDTNFQLLGAIVEAVTQEPFSVALKTRICDPIGLSQTYVSGHQAQTPAEAPSPIFFKDQRLDISLSLASMGADGGVVSTLDDLLAFLRAFFTGALFAPGFASVMQQWNPLFFPMSYGYGLMRFKLPIWMNLFRPTPELIGHPGASGSFAFHEPEQEILLAGTFNQTAAPRRPFGFMMQVLKTIQKHRDP